MTSAGKGGSQDAIGRQWAMLRRIPRAPRKVTATELAASLGSEGFHTSKRTVERDLLSLQALFPLVCDDRNRPFGWSWSKDAPVLDIPGLTPAEALSFEMAHRYLEPLLPASVLAALKPHFASAARAMSSSAVADVTHAWTSKVRVVHPAQIQRAPKIDRAAYDALTEALRSGRQVQARYRSEDTILHLRGLVQRGPITYFAATAHEYEDVRLYAAHRFSSAKVLELPIREISFDIDRWIASGALGFGSGKELRLVVTFTAQAAKSLQEAPLSSDQKLVETTGGKVRLTATVADTPQLLWWLRGYGEDVEVQRPKTLRDAMKHSARAISRLYQR